MKFGFLSLELKTLVDYDYTITIGQVSDHGIPFRTFQTLEKCPFHVEINERKIKK
jgi:hypothetical protein